MKEWKQFGWLVGLTFLLPSILVINRIIGGKKTFAFCSLVVVMSTIVGSLFGMMH